MVQARPRIGSKLPLVLILLGALTAFPFSTVKTAGIPQEGNDPAAHDARGLELYRLNRFEEAAVFFKQAIKLKQDYSEAHLHLGDTYLRSGEFKKAIEAYKQAVRYKPDFAMAHNNMGTAYFRLGEHKKAIDAFKEAIRLNPKEANPYYNLAATYLERGNQAAALEQYKLLKTIDPTVADKLFNLIYKPTANVYDSTVARLKVIVTDSQGAPINDLGKDDFQVSEEGAPQTVTSFAQLRSPLAYSLAIDTSGSLRPVFPQLINACKSILQNNLPEDETTLIRFISSDKIETVQEFTRDKKPLIAGLDSLYIESGQSAILDATYLSAQRVAQYKSDNPMLSRAVILVTDGDERASYYTMEALLNLLRQIDVQVFALRIDNGEKKRADSSLIQRTRPVDVLTKLAKETGGQVFSPKSVAELETQIQQMFSLIRAENVIEYKPERLPAAGDYRRVDVKIVPKPGRENWKVVHRPGYLVGEKAPEK